MGKNILRGLLVSLTLIITGCASIQKPIEIDTSKWKSNEITLAVFVKPLPKPYTHKVGAQGILDIAINNANIAGFSKIFQKPSIDLPSETFTV